MVIFLGSLFLILLSDCSCFKYQKEVVVIASSQEVINIEIDVEIVIDTSALIGIQKMKDKCQDINLLNESGIDQEFWIESGCNTEKTVIWTRTKLSNLGINLFYFLYGGTLPEHDSFAFQWDASIIVPFFDFSCPENDNFFYASEMNERFAMGGEIGDSGTVGGEGPSHNHPVVGETSGVDDTSTAPNNENEMKKMSRFTHQHSFDFLSSSDDAMPPYINLPYCSAVVGRDSLYGNNGIFFPVNALVLFESGAELTAQGFTHKSEINDKFPRCSLSDFAVPHGNTEHSHSVPGQPDCMATTNAGANYTVAIPFTEVEVSENWHVHSVTGHTLGPGSNMPAYSDMFFGTDSFYQVRTPVMDMIIMVTSDSGTLPVAGYETYDGVNGKFLRSSSKQTSSDIGTHTHSFSLTFDDNTDHFETSTGLTRIASNEVHDHTASGETQPFGSNLLFYSVAFLKRKGTSEHITVQIEPEEPYYYCYGIGESESAVCNFRKGLCDTCNCTMPFYGRECKEKITYAQRTKNGDVDIYYRLDLFILNSYMSKVTKKFNCSTSTLIPNYPQFNCKWSIDQTAFETSKLTILTKGKGHIAVVEVYPFTSLLYGDEIVVLEVLDYVKPKNTIAGVVTTVVFVFTCLCLVLLVVGVVLVVITVSYLRASRLKKRHESKLNALKDSNIDVDILLKENKLSIEGSKAVLSINKELFEIAYRDINLLERIGGGGSGCEIYKAKWKGKFIAFKVFKTSSFTSQGHFDEFERNITAFYGCCLNPPRVGIAMEYCSKGSIKDYLGQNKKTSLQLRVRVCRELVDVMCFLHSKSIIHRDLKPENLLLDKTMTMKLCDFGVSKVMKKATEAQTRGVGTSYYMAPEIVVGNKYDESCDGDFFFPFLKSSKVFSFGILLFEIVSYNFMPFGSPNELKARGISNIEYKISQDESFRPVIDWDNVEDSETWLYRLCTMCWVEDPQSRPPFSKISSIFESSKRQSFGKKPIMKRPKNLPPRGMKKRLMSNPRDNGAAAADDSKLQQELDREKQTSARLRERVLELEEKVKMLEQQQQQQKTRDQGQSGGGRKPLPPRKPPFGGGQVGERRPGSSSMYGRGGGGRRVRGRTKPMLPKRKSFHQ